MRKPKLSEFYDETTDTYDFEEYEGVMGDYEDSERDAELELQYEEGDELRRDEKNDK